MEAMKAIAEHALLRTRRPVLLAPARPRSNLSDPAMIAWDESPECWHAVSAAIPLLLHATSVEVVSVDRDAARRRASHEDVLTYLRCHGTRRGRVRSNRFRGRSVIACSRPPERLTPAWWSWALTPQPPARDAARRRHAPLLQNAAARPVLLAH